jgi:hypothetical protein
VSAVLEAAYAASGESMPDLGVSWQTINQRLGRDADDERTGRALKALVEAGYLREMLSGSDQTPWPTWVAVTEKGLQVTAGWPTGAADAAMTQLLADIDKHIDEASSEDERSRWQRLRDAVAGIGRDVAVEVLSAAAQAGMRSVT